MEIYGSLTCRGTKHRKHIMMTELEGKWTRGRQRMKMLDWMNARLNVKREQDLANVAKDKGKWKDYKPT